MEIIIFIFFPSIFVNFNPRPPNGIIRASSDKISIWHNALAGSPTMKINPGQNLFPPSSCIDPGSRINLYPLLSLSLSISLSLPLNLPYFRLLAVFDLFRNQCAGRSTASRGEKSLRVPFHASRRHLVAYLQRYLSVSVSDRRWPVRPARATAAICARYLLDAPTRGKPYYTPDHVHTPEAPCT